MDGAVEVFVRAVKEYGATHTCQDVARKFDIPYEVARGILTDDPKLLARLEKKGMVNCGSEGS